MVEINMEKAIEQATQILYENPNPAKSKLDRVIAWSIRHRMSLGEKGVKDIAEDLLISLKKDKKFVELSDRLKDSLKLMDKYNLEPDEKTYDELKDRGLIIK